MRASQTDYSGDNRRSWWQVQAERRVWHNPRGNLVYAFTGFDFSGPGQGGYYNPDRHHSNEALLWASGRLGAWALGRSF